MKRNIVKKVICFKHSANKYFSDFCLKQNLQTI